MATLWEALSSPANFPNYDARSDLGIGTLRARTHFHRTSQSTYPYIEPPQGEYEEEDSDEVHEEDEVDPVTQAKFRNATGAVRASDPYSARSVDNQYFTPSASTPFHLAKLGEATGSRSSRTRMSPMLGLYKGKEAVIGGAHSWNAVMKPIQHTRGTKMGYSMASKLLGNEELSPDDEKNDEFSVVSKIRRIVNAYHDLNMLQK